MSLISALLHLIISFQVQSRSIVKRSDIITGRGFAKPPAPQQNIHPTNYNIYQAEPYSYHNSYSDTYDTSDQYQNSDYYYDNNYGQTNSYQNERSYLPSSEYDKLKENLSLNDKLRSYIDTLKQKLEFYTSSKDTHHYERKTAVDLNRYQTGISHQSNNHNRGLATDQWLRNKQRFDQNQQSNTDQNQVDTGDDIITVDNIYKFVEPPKGPDSYTINVESNLNFSG